MVNGEPGPTRTYRRQVVNRPAIPQVNMVVEVRLHIEEEPMLGNGDGGQCAGGTLFTGNHHGTAKLVRQSSLNSISHQRQVQLTLTPHCSLGSTIRVDSGSGRQARLTGTDEVSEGSSALNGVRMLAPGISHWVRRKSCHHMLQEETASPTRDHWAGASSLRGSAFRESNPAKAACGPLL